MKTIFKYTLVMALALYVSACAKPEEPTNAQLLQGEWRLSSYVLNEEQREANYTDVSLMLERDNKFIFIEPNSRTYAGIWEATETELTLTASSGEVLVFTVVTLRDDFLHITRTVTNPVAGDLEFRYLYKRVQGL